MRAWSWVGALAFLVLVAVRYGHAQKLDRHLIDAIAGGATELDVVVLVADNPRHDVGDLAHRPRENRPLIKARRLRNARESQAGVRAFVDPRARKRVLSHVFANAVSTRLSTEDVLELAARPDVRRVVLDRRQTFRLRSPIPLDFAGALLSPAPPIGSLATSYTYGLLKIKTDQVWSLYGLKGSGVRIGNIDSGVDGNHPDVSGKILAFRDLVAGQTTSYDDDGHGTHTAGTNCGGETSGTAIGVAPSARLIVAKFLDASGAGTLSGAIGAMDFVTDPDANPTTDDGADVVSNSWGSSGVDETLRPNVQAWVTAGIVPVFAAGNDGPSGSTMGSPGAFPEVISVGATDSGDAIASFSSRGPAIVGGVSYIRPDVTAPGVGVLSARAGGGGYVSNNGTSMACPHVAGVVALMLEFNPALTVAQVKAALESTALDLGTAGKDNTYGSGRVDALAAVQAIAPTVRLTAPAPGARVAPGSPVTVRWAVGSADIDNPLVATYQVDLSTDSGQTFPTTIGTAGTSGRTVTWNVAADLRKTTVRVRVRGLKSDLSLVGEDILDSDLTVNGRPTAPSAPLTVVRPSVPLDLDGSAAADPDSDALGYFWRQSGGSQVVSITNANQPVATLTPSSLRGDLTAIDLGVTDFTETTTVTRLVRTNRLPPANAGADINARPSTLITLSGSGNSDPDGGATTYQWVQTGQSPGAPTINLGSSLTPAFVVPPTRGTTFTFQLRISDPLETATDDVRVKVNQLPVAGAGAPQKVIPGTIVTVRGNGSADPDLDALSYTWAWLAGTPVTVANATSVNATFQAPPTRGVSSTIQLTVSDGLDASTAQTVVTVNRLPAIVLSTPSLVRPGDQVVLSAAGTADADGDTVTYSWSQIAGSATVSFDPTSVAPSFTAPATRGVSMTFQLAAGDGLEQAISMPRVVRVNQVPVAGIGAPAVVAPGQSVQMDGTLSADPDGDPLTYAWSQAGGASVAFDRAAAKPTFTAPSTRGQELTFGLTVADGLESGSTQASLAVNQLPVPRAVLPKRIAPGAFVTMDGTSSSDPEGATLTYRWVQVKGATMDFAPAMPRPEFTAPATRGEEIAFELSVSDGLETASATFATKVNKPPLAKLPKVLSGAPDTRIVLSAKDSSDPDEDELTFRWKQVSGPDVVYTEVGREIEVDLSALARGTELGFEVEASDGQETSTASTTVRVNRAPEAGAARTASTLPGTSFSLKSEASDPDGDPLTYRWRQTSGPPVEFTADARTLVFTAPPKGRQSLGFELAVSDGVETATTIAAVELTDRAYESDLGGAAAGGCQARRGAASREPADLSLTLLLLAAAAALARRTAGSGN